MNDHTPGPWLAEPDGANDWKVRSDDYGTIVNRNCYPDAKVDTTVEADARLIAAAPDLLATAAAMIRAIDNMTTEEFMMGRDHEQREALRAAVAKAVPQ